MRTFLLTVACLAFSVFARAESFEIKDGDRVIFLGDTLIEREGTYGYLETRMVEQFPDRKFTVRNLAFSADTPLGWSRASFDPPAKGFERLKEQIALVKPTVVFLGYGMAASLQEMTDRSQDWTLNRDPARYGAEPMSAARFKKELAQCMDAIEFTAKEQSSDADGTAKERSGEGEKASASESPASSSPLRSFAVKKSPVRFVLLSPIKHEDLRAIRPGLPDPTEHNKLLEQYSKAIEELAKERGAFFVQTAARPLGWGDPNADQIIELTDNGIHPHQLGYDEVSRRLAFHLGWRSGHWEKIGNRESEIKNPSALRAAIIRKNALFFHRWRPANETYLFGFRKREQGQNAVEIPKFDPLIEAAEAEIERLKKPGSAQSSVPSAQTAQPAANSAPVTSHQSPGTAADRPALPAPQTTLPLPTFTLADGLEISLWAENPLLAKPTEMNWDAQGRLWVASSAMYPMIAPGQAATDKIIILEDPGHTGKATKSTVFVDGLLLPTGVAPVLVGNLGSEKEDLGSGENGGSRDGKAGGKLPKSNFLNPKFGCYVGQSTELLYFEDTDGDGKADKKRIVLSGFGTEDTHHIVHTLRWGPDGRLYFNQSVYIHTHMETPWGVVRLSSGGVFAYDPRTERVEVFCKGLWNTWGHAWDRWGQSFLTDGAGFTGLSWAFPGAVFNPSEGSRRQMASISPGSYPKFAGIELIYSPHFPADWQGTAVTCDFRAHKIVQFKINDLGAVGTAANAAGAAEGKNAASPATPNASSSAALAATAAVHSPKSGYVTEQLPVLAQTADATFRPIDVKLGPDGALYIADWSNPIINHGEVDFRDPRRDHEHGRIWRLSRKGGTAVKWESLVAKPSTALAPHLASESAWDREQANQILIHRLHGLYETKDYAAEAQAAGKKLTEAQRTVLALSDWARKNPEPLNLLSVFRIFAEENAIEEPHLEIPLVILPLAHKTEDPNVLASILGIKGRSFMRVLGLSFLKQLKEVQEKLRKDDELTGGKTWVSRPDMDYWKVFEKGIRSQHPRVRVEAMRAIARIPIIESASLILDAAINAPKDDPQYEFAAWLSINDLAEVWTEAVLAGKWKIEGREKQLEFALDALDAARSGPVIAALLKQRPITRDGAGPWIELIGRGGGKAELQQLFERVAKSDFEQPALVRAMNALAAAARLRNFRPDGTIMPLVDLLYASLSDTRAAAARLAGLWKLPEAAPHLQSLAKGPDNEDRAAAFEGLRSLGGEPAIAVLRKLVRSGIPPVPPDAIVVLAQLQPAAAIAEIPAVLGAIKSAPELLATWRGIFQSKEATDLLAKNFPANLPPAAITAALRAARELGRKGDRLVAKLAPLAGESLANVVPADFADLAARAKKDGDPVAGEALYRRTASACVACHAIGGAGGKLGPDLTSIGASAPADYIIESILNPAAKVKEGYHAFAFAMKDGSEAIGIPTRETPQEQFIRTVAGEQGLPKANIVSKKIAEGGASGASLMPAGLTAAWTDRERLNLYAFLMELGRPGPFDASKNNVARVWQLSESDAKSGVLPSAPTNTTSIPAYTLVDGRLTKDLLAEKITVLAPKSATAFLTARFQAASTGKAKLNLTGIRKAWLDGKPLAIASEPSPSVVLTAGAHTFTVEVDAKSPPEVLRLESPAVSFLGD